MRHWILTQLDDGTPWVSDGMDSGFNPETVTLLPSGDGPIGTVTSSRREEDLSDGDPEVVCIPALEGRTLTHRMYISNSEAKDRECDDGECVLRDSRGVAYYEYLSPIGKGFRE